MIIMSETPLQIARTLSFQSILNLHAHGTCDKHQVNLENMIQNADTTCGCGYDRFTDSAQCNDTEDSYCELYECIPGFDGDCPARTLHYAKRKLSLLKRPTTMTHVFSSPTLAAFNDFLKNEHLVYSHL